MPSPGYAGQLSGGGGGGEAKLYRASHGTFEEYCRERWGMARSTAYQLVDASKVVENVRHGGQIPPPESERQARPLAKLPAEEQAPPCPATGGGFFVPSSGF